MRIETEEHGAHVVIHPKGTFALGEATHPGLKEHTWVIVEGHDAHRWGRNAKPWDEGAVGEGVGIARRLQIGRTLVRRILKTGKAS